MHSYFVFKKGVLRGSRIVEKDGQKACLMEHGALNEAPLGNMASVKGALFRGLPLRTPFFGYAEIKKKLSYVYSMCMCEII